MGVSDHSGSEPLKSLNVFAGHIWELHGVKQSMNGCDVVLHLAALDTNPIS
jgi:dTDP-glucose 4,6-dehydratase